MTQRFSTINDYLTTNPKTDKIIMRSGKIYKNTFTKWSKTEEEMLEKMLAKRSAAAIRKKMWSLVRKMEK